MAFVTSFNGVIFIEGDHPRAWKKFSAKTTVGGFGSQLRNLNDLKQQMAYTAMNNGCNCVVNFTYGQRSKIWTLDDVAFVGDGFYAVLSYEDYNSIIVQLQKQSL